MSAAPEILAPALPLAHFLRQPGERSLLRFSTAGSVDDGKSTLIGRLLHDTRSVYEDQIEAVRKSPINRSGTALDFSLLTDGLRAEREQGITIDVAYRYFSTPRRTFIIADTPGHEQYTPNMATGASTADAAVILVDVRKGVLPQSRRHAFIAALLGVPELVVAVNKMDLAGYSQAAFEEAAAAFRALEPRLRGARLTFIPVSALEGDNVVERSPRMPWYGGPSLLEFLETVEPQAAAAAGPFRMPVQYVIRPRDGFRGFAGQIVSGRVRPGDPVLELPSARQSRVQRIVTFDGDLEEAVAPLSVTLTLEDELDVSRGSLLAAASAPPRLARRFEAHTVWMSSEPLSPSKTYLLRHGPLEVQARAVQLRHAVDIETLEPRAAETLGWSEIGLVVWETSRPLAFDPYRDVRGNGAFILIDPISNRTIAAGMIEAAVEDPGEQRRQRRRPVFRAGRLTAGERRTRSGHSGALILARPASEAACWLERRLFEHGADVVLLDERVAPIEPLLRAGLLVIAPPDSECRGFPVVALPEEAGADPERAAALVLEELERRGVLIPRDAFLSGEGI
ncbi:MAG: GTP-binding protein [Bryobacteraceae bacterium]|nr:GTP-binding protein [Bryobacteraceae bacterium]